MTKKDSNIKQSSTDKVYYTIRARISILVQYRYTSTPLCCSMFLSLKIFLHMLDRRTHPRVCILGCILAKANVRTFVHSFLVLFICTFISEINSSSCFPSTASSFQQISVLLCRVAFPSDKRNAREKQRSKEDARWRFCLKNFVKKRVYVSGIIKIKLKKGRI